MVNSAQLNFSWVRKDGVFRWVSDDVRSKSLSFSLTVSEDDSRSFSKAKSIRFFASELSSEFSDSELKNTAGDLIVLYK